MLICANCPCRCEEPCECTTPDGCPDCGCKDRDGLTAYSPESMPPKTVQERQRESKMGGAP